MRRGHLNIARERQPQSYSLTINPKVRIPFRRFFAVSGILLLLALLGLAYYLFRPLAIKPVPAAFHHYDLTHGSFVALDPPPEIFAVGLSYAKHIEETASEFDPAAVPPIFHKHPRAWVGSAVGVTMPDTDALCAAAEELEPGLGKTLRQKYPELPALLDYEGELGLVLLEDIDTD